MGRLSIQPPPRSSMNQPKPEGPEDCVGRTASGLVTSALFGGLVGAVEAMWTDAPAVKAEKTGPAIRATWQCVARSSVLFGLVGGTFATGDCMAQSVRGKDDVWNGVYGGLAAGGVFAMKTASPLRGLGAGLCFGAVSAMVDLSGQRLQPERWSDPTRTFNYGHAVKLE